MNQLRFKYEFVKALKSINEGNGVTIPSTGIQKLANYISKAHIKEMAKEIVANPQLNVSDFLYRNVPSFHAAKKEQFFKSLGEGSDGGELEGQTVDNFSAFMVSRVLNKLSNEQKVRLLNRPLQEIIAISYKLASRSEF